MLNEQTILITGATGAIGAAIARAVVTEGELGCGLWPCSKFWKQEVK